MTESSSIGWPFRLETTGQSVNRNFFEKLHSEVKSPINLSRTISGLKINKGIFHEDIMVIVRQSSEHDSLMIS